MAIKTRKLNKALRFGRAVIFGESELVAGYCGGKGVELVATAHNPFGLQGSINVAPDATDKRTALAKRAKKMREDQAEMCGEYALIDEVGDPTSIPLGDNSVDYIIASHVIEKEPDILGALREMCRVLVEDGVIVFIIPRQDQLPEDDRGVPWTDEAVMAALGSHTGELSLLDEVVWAFTLESFLDFLSYASSFLMCNFEVLETEEVDSKVGNGFTVVVSVSTWELESAEYDEED